MINIKHELDKIWIMLNKHEKALFEKTRQRKWQESQRLKNKCMLCNKKVYKAQCCKHHYDVHKKYQNKRYKIFKIRTPKPFQNSY